MEAEHFEITIPEDTGEADNSDETESYPQQIPLQRFHPRSGNGSDDEAQKDSHLQKPIIITDTVVESLTVLSDANSSSESHDNDTVLPTATGTAKWYFVPDLENDQTNDGSKTILKHKCSTEYHAPVPVGTSTQGIEWEVHRPEVPTGVYEIILGVSVEELRVELVESIAFSILWNGTPVGASETILEKELKRLWESADEYAIQMTITKGVRALSDENPGFLHMHFMELRPFRNEGYADGNVTSIPGPHFVSNRIPANLANRIY
ncbi:hypothetical protein BGZ50_008172 [Haplosporangium sp. Z 11]|nr:hypothetical protein BGZ50_008172 [Haplosporangium sp. Z 11]